MLNWLKGESPSAELQRLKEGYLRKAREELLTTHPEDIPDTLLSVFTQNLINDPVITLNGKVYDSAGINKWLTKNETDERRQPLTRTMLHPFPELNGLIKDYQNLLQTYKNKKELLLDSARNAAKDPTQEIPKIFICPISLSVIGNPVISKTGYVFDKESVPLEIVKPFKEFDQYLKLFRWKIEKCEKRSQKKMKYEEQPKKYAEQQLKEKCADQEPISNSALFFGPLFLLNPSFFPQMISKYGLSFFGQLTGLLNFYFFSQDDTTKNVESTAGLTL